MKFFKSILLFFIFLLPFSVVANTNDYIKFVYEFDFGTYTVSDTEHENLKQVADVINARKSFAYIIGHTDSVGDSKYNLSLSKKRANTIASILYRYGVNKERVMILGAGELKPIKINNLESNRESNRRVEIWLLED